MHKDNKWLEPLEKNLNYKFNDINFLKTALTHSSYTNEHNMKNTENNERLEFLGDTILSLIVSQYLYKKYPYYPEGELTKIRAKVVCESSLAFAAKKINLGEFLLLGKGEEVTGGRLRDSILADASEALMGAVYLDSDFEVVNNLMLKKFENDLVHAVAKGSLFVDYKTDLQENLQKRTKSQIEYRIKKEEGPDHDKIFYIDVLVDNKFVGTGSGRNKKEAEQMAAKEALLILGETNG
ncbi:MAG TPA: ribonuclease III [Tissierellaceae bacterium]|nr:ribonuclease III [Tissierellaceae bacterium]